jgi:hypothetical protein
VEQFKQAIVYGKSVKHQPQRVGLSHELADEDISQFQSVPEAFVPADMILFIQLRSLSDDCQYFHGLLRREISSCPRLRHWTECFDWWVKNVETNMSHSRIRLWKDHGI